MAARPNVGDGFAVPIKTAKDTGSNVVPFESKQAFMEALAAKPGPLEINVDEDTTRTVMTRSLRLSERDNIMKAATEKNAATGATEVNGWKLILLTACAGLVEPILTPTELDQMPSPVVQVIYNDVKKKTDATLGKGEGDDMTPFLLRNGFDFGSVNG